MATVFVVVTWPAGQHSTILRVRRHLHKRVTVDTDKTPTSVSMEKQAWKAESVDKIAIY